MSHLTKNFGVVCEKESNRVSIFDTDTLSTLHYVSLPFGSNPIDVAITPDLSKALVTSFSNNTLYTIDLLQEPPVLAHFVVSSPGNLEDIDITSDGRFAVIAGNGYGHYIKTYDLQSNTFLSQLYSNVHAVAVSQNNSGKIYTVNDNQLKVFNINLSTGILTDPNIAVSSPELSPINIVLSKDSKFAFVLTRPLSGSTGPFYVLVFNITGTVPIFLHSISVPYTPQSATLSCDGTKLYVLTGKPYSPIGSVQIFNFTQTFPYLIPLPAINHNLPIVPFVGVDQIALNSNETTVFISSASLINQGNKLAAYRTDGPFIGYYPNIIANGSVVTKHRIIPTTTAPTTAAPTTATPTTAAPTTAAPTTAAPTTAVPTTAAPTTAAPTPTPCPCCFVDQRAVVYARCELEKSETFNNITLNCTGRFLDVNVILRNVCPNKLINVGVLVYDAQNRLISIKVCRLFTGDGPNCIPSLNVGKFCFVFDDESCPPPRTFTVRIVANYLELTRD